MKRSSGKRKQHLGFMKALITAIALVVVVIVAFGAILESIDLNPYRARIETALTQETGRTVRLQGPMHIGFSRQGLVLSVRDAKFGNPSWSSRRDMASIQVFEIRLGLLALLSNRIDIDALTLENADILLEAPDAAHHNWAMQETAPAEESNASGNGTAPPVAVNITSLAVKNSRIAVRGPDQSLTTFRADDLTIQGDGGRVVLRFAGSYNDMPIKATLAISGDSLMAEGVRPLDLDIAAGIYHLTAKGSADLDHKQCSFEECELVAGDSKISGVLRTAWGGANPVVEGTLQCGHLTVSDFVPRTPARTAAASPVPVKTSSASRMFSDAPLPLDLLKSVNANLDIAIAALSAGSQELHNVKTKLRLDNGNVHVSSFSMNLGDGSIAGQANFDARVSPAQFSGVINANDIDLGDVVKFGGAEAFLYGKVKADLNLAANGDSLHALASSMTGPITVVGAGGDVVTGAAGKIASGISEILAPGSGGTGNVNCIVARLIVKDGIVRGHGILVDTAAATAAGYGDIDLRSETINLDFRSRTKLLDIGTLLPSVHVGGTLLQPSVAADPTAIVQNVGSMMTGGNTDPVPDVVAQQGQNACLLALNNGSPTSSGGLVQDLAGKAKNFLQKTLGN